MSFTSSHIRQKFLDFFQTKQHAIIQSAPVVPENDPSVLFNTAGMQPLVPYLLGEKHPMGTRLADVQKCVRTGDIDDVGDNRHLTFFEMLGNWSLGDYFKQESIAWSYEFLTDARWLGIDPKMLCVTVFEGNADAPRDEESAEIWKKFGIPTDRICYLPAEDNWWAAGSTGPCGPDTEIFYWIGEGAPNPSSNVQNDSKNWMEIWNNVFMQFDRQTDGTLKKLAAPCVDTGMGLERVTATLNGFKHVFDTDVFVPILAEIRTIVGEKYLEKSARIVADHVRSAVHMIADGVYPKNVAQGYVLRRLLRRATREMLRMGVEGASLSQVARVVVEQFRSVYASVATHEAKIYEEITKEETKFGNTLKKGVNELEKILAKLPAGSGVSGEDTFRLFDTFGFPLELTAEMAKERGYEADIADAKIRFAKHQELSRTASAGMFKGGLGEQSEITTKLHTATHLMLAGLRHVLGDHVHQAGSNITPERLRFDFTHPEKVTSEQLAAVEVFVNSAIQADAQMHLSEMKKEEAKAAGVEGSFWEKYPDIVKVYSFQDASGKIWSRELCGGPHAASTKLLGSFSIQKEEASSSGVRRIKAVIS